MLIAFHYYAKFIKKVFWTIQSSLNHNLTFTRAIFAYEDYLVKRGVYEISNLIFR